MSTLTYKCPNCDGGLIFDPGSGSYVCEYCLSKFSKEELYAETEQAHTPQSEVPLQADDSQETAVDGNQEEDSCNGAVEYHCPSCGAEIIAEETTAATYCFYCHNPIVLSGKLEGKYLPDGIIPFKIAKEEAVQKFHAWIQKKKFIPSGFYSKKQIEKMTGVYFPYWIYNCDTESVMNGTARDIRVWRVGDTQYTETKTYEIRRSGNVIFRHLPKTALKKAQTAMLKGIFPYNFQEMEKFHMGYLSGFQAEKRDIEKDYFSEEILKEINNYAEKRMRDTISGHQSFSVNQRNYTISKEQFQYTLLPVWILTYREKGNAVYYFAMNGQTGEIVGKLPIDSKKVFGLSACVFAVVFAIFLFGGLLL